MKFQRVGLVISKISWEPSDLEFKTFIIILKSPQALQNNKAIQGFTNCCQKEKNDYQVKCHNNHGYRFISIAAELIEAIFKSLL